MPIQQWANDGDARREAKNVPFHLLERIKTYGTSNENGESENLLVHGDNLIAIRALLPFYRGRVISSFESMVEEGAYIVDKTRYLKSIFKDGRRSLT